MSDLQIRVDNPTRTQAVFWGIAQIGGVVATVGLLAGLTARPELTLHVLWDGVVPVLPAVFLFNPIVWRNVCPLATLNKLTGDRWGRAELKRDWTPKAGAIGVALLFILVPARRFVFNQDGLALAVTILIVAVLALAAGAVFSAKAGFCNAICPVLPVERLYGQRPLRPVANARCAPCTGCTKRGCVDLSPSKSVAQTISTRRRSARWLTTPFGVFAASFPGFVYAYNTVADGPLGSALPTYGHFLVWCALSYALVTAYTLVRPGRNERTLLVLGGISVGLYYWFATPTLIATLALPAAIVGPTRAIVLSVVGLWLGRALRTPRRTRRRLRPTI